MEKGELLNFPYFRRAMKATYIDYSDTHSFSSTALSYLSRDPKLRPFISHFPTTEGFGKLIEEKTVCADRKVLVEVLKRQYGESLKLRVESLKFKVQSPGLKVKSVQGAERGNVRVGSDTNGQTLIAPGQEPSAFSFQR